MQGRFNLGGKAATGGLPFPLYQQINEPVKKDGLWVKTSNKLKNIYLGYKTEDIDQTWFEVNSFSRNFSNVVNINEDIYFLGGPDSDSLTNRKNIRYNIESNTFTQLAELPYKFSGGCTVVVGTDIYILGSSYNPTQNLRYDTLTNTYTELKKIPYNFSNGSAVVIDNEIHLIGGSAGSSAGIKKHYLYNIETNDYTQLADIPIEFRFGQAAYIDDSIYLFGIYSSNGKSFEYNISEDTYSEIKAVPGGPSIIKSSIVKYDNYIYLFFNRTSPLLPMLRYNVLTNEYEELENIVYESGDIQGAVLINNDIYIFDNYNNKKIYKLALNPTFLPGIYLTFDLYPKEIKRYLFKEMYKTIIRVEVFSKTEKLDYEAYIGDGTTWNLLNEGD